MLSPDAPTFNPAAPAFVPASEVVACAPTAIPQGGAWGAGGMHSAAMLRQNTLPQPA
eukprot:CAMPEP_0180204256 /NCGR_PEP_ID=MMETSP0987-20121128/8320_1 /TAXON_ID=697907 /ORGANISM="non described non described, Strain CCMP2293" /LENGTH=56 /DNA_ID=CAMNT_0022159745 /DNA_START=94 /DNA_END=264 /DNA_ORIENTATION=-